MSQVKSTGLVPSGHTPGAVPGTVGNGVNASSANSGLQSGVHGVGGRGQSVGNVTVRRQSGTSTETVLGVNCQIRGRLDLQGRAQIDGNIDGEIVIEGELIIGPTAVVKANILATRAIIAGRLTGDIRCEERLELRGGAYLTGDIAAPQVVMEDGVVFDGRCWMEQSEEEQGVPS